MRAPTLAPALLATVLATALAACNAPAPVEVREAGRLAPADRIAASAVARPMSGTCETTFVPPPFPLPPSYRQVDEGTCQLTHLGRAALYSDKTITFATGTQVTHALRLTAANGDEVHATGAGRNAPAGPGQIGFTATMTIAGGTGRFADATGELRIEGVASLATRSSTLRIVEGWIDY